MKPNQTSPKGNAARVAKQVSIEASKHIVTVNRAVRKAAAASGTTAKPWWRRNEPQPLIPGNDQTDDCLWASRQGLLYVWDGVLATEPREVTFDAAREWWKQFRNPRFAFASPFFKEGTAADKLVCMVTDDWLTRQWLLEQRLGSLEQSSKKTMAHLAEINAVRSEVLKRGAPPIDPVASAPGEVSPKGTAAVPAVLNPVQCATDLVTAIVRQRRCIGEAGALALMQADAMKSGMEDFDGWQALDKPGVGAGFVGVASKAMARLNGSVDDFFSSYMPAIRKMFAQADKPVACGEVGGDEWKRMREANGLDVDHSIMRRMEHCVSALRALLDSQGAVMSKRNLGEAFALCDSTAEDLRSGFDVLFRAAHNFDKVVVAVALAGERAGERRAA